MTLWQRLRGMVRSSKEASPTSGPTNSTLEKLLPALIISIAAAALDINLVDLLNYTQQQRDTAIANLAACRAEQPIKEKLNAGSKINPTRP